MQQDTGKRSLEGLKIFPYIAWILTFGFAVFVYYITTDLQAVTTDLQTQTRMLEQQINQANGEADFDAYNAERQNGIGTLSTE